MTQFRDFVHHTTAGMLGECETAALWTVVHRGYSGNRRVDVWAYPDLDTALRGAAELALSCGIDEDAQAVDHHRRGEYAEVIRRYLASSPDWHVLSVQESPLMEDPDTFSDWDKLK
jgi:hypothetical protein